MSPLILNSVLIYLALLSPLSYDRVACASHCHLPTPGVSRMRQGVDITRLNMLPKEINGDAGMRGVLFDLTCRSSRIWTHENVRSATYTIPDQITSITSLPTGTKRAKSDISKTVDEVKTLSATSLGIDPKQEDGLGAFSLSTSSKSAHESIVQRKEILANIHIEMSAYEIHLVPADQLPLNFGFNRSIHALPRTYETDPSAFHEFVHQFGSHFFSSAKFGGYLYQTNAISESYYYSVNSQELETKLKEEVEGMFQDVGDGGEDDYIKELINEEGPETPSDSPNATDDDDTSTDETANEEQETEAPPAETDQEKESEVETNIDETVSPNATDDDSSTDETANEEQETEAPPETEEGKESKAETNNDEADEEANSDQKRRKRSAVTTKNTQSSSTVVESEFRQNCYSETNYFGGIMTGDLHKWAKSAMRDPWLYKGQLTSIVTLIRTTSARAAAEVQKALTVRALLARIAEVRELMELSSENVNITLQQKQADELMRIESVLDHSRPEHTNATRTGLLPALVKSVEDIYNFIMNENARVKIGDNLQSLQTMFDEITSCNTMQCRISMDDEREFERVKQRLAGIANSSEKYFNRQLAVKAVGDALKLRAKLEPKRPN